MPRRSEPVKDRAACRITRSIDRWSELQGLGTGRPEHQLLAEFIAAEIEGLLMPRTSTHQVLLVDTGPSDPSRYTNPRLAEASGSPEEDLWPEDPNTGSPVEEAVAHAVLPLIAPEEVPEL